MFLKAIYEILAQQGGFQRGERVSESNSENRVLKK